MGDLRPNALQKWSSLLCLCETSQKPVCLQTARTVWQRNRWCPIRAKTLETSSIAIQTAHCCLCVHVSISNKLAAHLCIMSFQFWRKDWENAQCLSNSFCDRALGQPTKHSHTSIRAFINTPDFRMSKQDLMKWDGNSGWKPWRRDISAHTFFTTVCLSLCVWEEECR